MKKTNCLKLEEGHLSSTSKRSILVRHTALATGMQRKHYSTIEEGHFSSTSKRAVGHAKAPTTDMTKTNYMKIEDGHRSSTSIRCTVVRHEAPITRGHKT